MVEVDYKKYAEDQKSWAKILVEKAELDNGGTDREYAMLAIMAINRPVGAFSATELPDRQRHWAGLEPHWRRIGNPCHLIIFCILCDTCHFAVSPAP